jgi:hypothetical protein
MSLIDLCTSCGKDYPVDEMTDGVCMGCIDGLADSDRVPLDFDDKPKFSFDQLYDKIDKTGDCV